MTALRPKRATSVELGDGDFAIKYNSNGRPVRKSAGKKYSPTPGYVDSGAIDQQLLDIADDALSPDESEFSEGDDEMSAKKKSRKRKRDPSPTPPPLSPLPPDDLPSPKSSPQRKNLAMPEDVVDLEPINLTFNIQPGFTGPLKVQLDLSQVSVRARKRHRSSLQQQLGSSHDNVVSRASDAQRTGFLSLPPGMYLWVAGTGKYCIFQIPVHQTYYRANALSIFWSPLDHILISTSIHAAGDPNMLQYLPRS